MIHVAPLLSQSIFSALSHLVIYISFGKVNTDYLDWDERRKKKRKKRIIFVYIDLGPSIHGQTLNTSLLYYFATVENKNHTVRNMWQKRKGFHKHHCF